jgi:hypothetical protein
MPYQFPELARVSGPVGWTLSGVLCVAGAGTYQSTPTMPYEHLYP